MSGGGRHGQPPATRTAATELTRSGNLRKGQLFTRPPQDRQATDMYMYMYMYMYMLCT